MGSFLARRGAISDDLDTEDVAGVRTLHALPSRVYAGIAADQPSVVPHQAVRVARSGFEHDGHQALAGFAVVLVQTGIPLGVARAVVAGHDPDIVFVVERHIVKARPLVGTHANQDVGNPRFGVDAQYAAETQGSDPELALVPFHTVASAAAAVE